MVNLGSISYSDIYGAGSDDTLPASVNNPTTQQTNPNNSEVTGQTKPGEEGIIHVFKSKNILGQPIMVWFGLIALLLGIKYFVEVSD